MTTKISVLFYLRKSKGNSKGLMPIYQRITIDGERFDKSTGHYVEEAKWNAPAGKMKGSNEEARTVNSRLDLHKANVYEIEKRLFMAETEINFENFRNEFLGIKERERMLIPIFTEHNRKIKELIGHEYAPETLERYKTSLKHKRQFSAFLSLIIVSILVSFIK